MLLRVLEEHENQRVLRVRHRGHREVIAARPVGAECERLAIGVVAVDCRSIEPTEQAGFRSALASAIAATTTVTSTTDFSTRGRTPRRKRRVPLGVDRRGVRQRRAVALAYLAAFTTRIKLGTAVVQLTGRTPATLAMHAMTIDALAGGNRHDPRHRRVRAADRRGLVRASRGAGRTPRLRDYVEIIRKVLDRDGAGRARRAPRSRCRTAGPGRSARARPLKSIMHPVARVPHLAGVGRPAQHGAVPRSCATGGCRWASAGGVDGSGRCSTAVREAARSGRGPGPETFEIFTGAPITITDDVRRRSTAMRPLTAMYVGGMGSATPQLPPRRDGPARLPGRGGADRRAVARRPQGRGDRRRPRRLSRAEHCWSGRRTASGAVGTRAYPASPVSPA